MSVRLLIDSATAPLPGSRSELISTINMLRTTFGHAKLLRSRAFHLRDSRSCAFFGSERVTAPNRPSTFVTRSLSTKSEPDQTPLAITDKHDWIKQFSAATLSHERLALLKKLQELQPVDGKPIHISSHDVQSTIQRKVINVLDMPSAEIVSSLSVLTPLNDGVPWKRMLILLFRKLPKNHSNLHSKQISTMLNCLNAIGFDVSYEKLYIKQWLLSQVLKILKHSSNNNTHSRVPPAHQTSIIKNILAVNAIPPQEILCSWLRKLSKLPATTPDIHTANMNLIHALRTEKVLFKELKPETQELLLKTVQSLIVHHMQDSNSIMAGRLLKALVILQVNLNDPAYTNISSSLTSTIVNNLHLIVQPLKARELNAVVSSLEYHTFTWSSLPPLAQQSILTSFASSVLTSESEFTSMTLRSLSKMGLQWQDIPLTTQQLILDQLTSLLSQNHQIMTTTDQNHAQAAKLVANTLRMMETVVSTWHVKVNHLTDLQQEPFHTLTSCIPSLTFMNNQQLRLLSKAIVFTDKIEDLNYRQNWLTAFFNFLQSRIETAKLTENEFFDMLVILSNDLNIERSELKHEWIDLLFLCMKNHFLKLSRPRDYDGGRVALLTSVLTRLEFTWGQLDVELRDLLLSEFVPYSKQRPSNNNKAVDHNAKESYNRAHRRDPLFLFSSLSLLGVHWHQCDESFRTMIVDHVKQLTAKDITDQASCAKLSRIIAAFPNMHVDWHHDELLPREHLQQLFVNVEFRHMDNTSLAKCYWAFPEMGASWSDLSTTLKYSMVSRLLDRMVQLDGEQMSNVMHSTAMLAFDARDITNDKQLMNLLHGICKQFKNIKDDPVCWEQWLSYDESIVSNMQIFLEFLNTFPVGKKILLDIFDDGKTITCRRIPSIYRLLQSATTNSNTEGIRKPSSLHRAENLFNSCFISKQREDNPNMVVVKHFRPFNTIYPMNLALFDKATSRQLVAFVLFQSARQPTVATRSWLFKKHLYRFHFPKIPLFCPQVYNLTTAEEGGEVEAAVTELMNEIKGEFATITNTSNVK